MNEPRGQRTVPESKEPIIRPILRGPGPKATGGIIHPGDGIRADPGPPELVLPRPTTPDARTTRATALTVAARIHQGRGTSPYRVAQDAEVLAEYLRSGVVAEDPQLAEPAAGYMTSAEMLDAYGITPYEPPHAEPPGPGLLEMTWQMLRRKGGRR